MHAQRNNTNEWNLLETVTISSCAEYKVDSTVKRAGAMYKVTALKDRILLFVDIILFF